jgi:hypothetical protein
MPHDTTSEEPEKPACGRDGLESADKFEAEGPMAVQEITYPSGAGRGAGWLTW